MFENIVIWIYAAGIFQAIFLAISLVTLNIRNRPAVYALSALMVLMAIVLVEQAADSSGVSFEMALGLAIEFAMAPLLYIFIRSIAEPDWRLVRKTALHFIPMILALVFLAVLHRMNAGGNLGIAHEQFGGLITGWVFVKLFYFSAYALVTERILRKAIPGAKGVRASSLKWIYRWLLLVFAAFAASYLVFVLFLAGVPIWQDSDVYTGIANFIIIFSIAYFVLANRKALDHTPPKPVAATPETARNAEAISALMRAERPYLEPEFSLEQLSEKLSLPAKDLLAAIAQLNGLNYADYVNALRLDEFDTLVRDPANKSKTTLELAYAAGFNSKATFYRAFKAEKGMTPSQYRENL